MPNSKLVDKTLNHLIERIRVLEEAIRSHRSQRADDRCIEDDDRLYETLGDGVKCDRRVGSTDEMLENCKRFIKNRCLQGHWPTYAELETERDTLQARNRVLQACIDLAKGKPAELIDAFASACAQSEAGRRYEAQDTSPEELARFAQAEADARAALEVALLPGHFDTEARRPLAKSQVARVALQVEAEPLRRELTHLREVMEVAKGTHAEVIVAFSDAVWEQATETNSGSRAAVQPLVDRARTALEVRLACAETVVREKIEPEFEAFRTERAALRAEIDQLRASQKGSQ